MKKNFILKYDSGGKGFKRVSYFLWGLSLLCVCLGLVFVIDFLRKGF